MKIKTLLILLIILLGLSVNAQTITKFTVNDGGNTFIYCTFPGSTECAFYRCPNISGDVEIPNTVMYNGVTYSVTSIWADAFRDRENLKSVTIPNSVILIMDYAFKGCSGLTSVNIPNSITDIRDHAFMDCKSLTSFDIPNSVTKIGQEAFRGCSLDYFRLDYGDSPLKIGKDIFREASIKKLIIFRDCTYDFTNSYGNGVQSIVIGETITKLPNYAFNNYTNLKSVLISNSVTSIGNFTFLDCKNLESITLPNSLTTIGDKAFYGCTALKTVETTAAEPPLMSETSFDGLYGQATLFFPKNYLNSYLTSNWTLFENLKYADGDVEHGIDTYSDGVLSYYIFPAENENENNFAVVKPGDYKNLTTVAIPERFTDENLNRYYITQIGGNAFKGCSALKEITFNKRSTISIIGGNAFSGTAITTINLPSTVTTIGNSAFDGCNLLTSFTGPSSLTEIGNFAFRGCLSMTSVILPNSVTKIGNSAFYGCKYLNSINMPDSLTSIGDYGFYYCNLKDVKIPNSVISIGDYAFGNCGNLISITIPNSVSSIPANTFYNCTKWEKLTIEDGDSPLVFYTNDLSNYPIKNLYIGRNWKVEG